MYKSLTVLLVLQLFMLPSASVAQESPPGPSTDEQTSKPEIAGQADPFTDGLARAKRDGKYLWVVLYNNDCPDCTRLEQTVLKAPKVAEWAERYAVVVKLNGSESTGRNFAETHRIDTFPTVLFMTGDGRELGRQIGYITQPRFRIKLDAVINDKAIRGESLMDPWAGENVVLAAMAEAEVLTAEGKFDQALARYVWCFEHRVIHSPIFTIKKLPSLIDGLAKLGEHHPPAKKELTDRVAVAEHNTLGRQQFDAFSLYMIKLGNLALQREDRIVAHYEVLKSSFPDGAVVEVFGRLIYEQLLKAGRYRDLRYSVADTEELDHFFADRELGKDEARQILSARYQVHLGLGEEAKASNVANRLLFFDNSAETYRQLALAGLRSGRANSEIIKYARKWHRMVGGKNVEAVTTLARLLDRNRPQDPATVQLLSKALSRAESQDDKEAIEECLREIRTAPPKETEQEEPVISRDRKKR